MEQIMSWVTENWRILVEAVALLTAIIGSFQVAKSSIVKRFRQVIENAKQSVHLNSPGGKEITAAESKAIANSVKAFVDVLEKQRGLIVKVLEFLRLFKK